MAYSSTSTSTPPMASSSTSTSTPHTVNNDNVFDVFINHRGPDVKKAFATPLYNCLCIHDLKVFLDEQELLVGGNLTPQIESAIRTSSVNIAIFSPNYADSIWCLNELVEMVECMSKCKFTIIPVFYDVKPTELRWVKEGKGDFYAQALRKLQEKKNRDGQQRYRSEELEKWKTALSKVSYITGFDGEKYNSMEQLLEDVVEGVLKNVKRRLYVSEYPTGLQAKLNDFETTMSLQQGDGKVRVKGSREMVRLELREKARLGSIEESEMKAPNGSSEESGSEGDESSGTDSSEESGYQGDESWGTDSSEENASGSVGNLAGLGRVFHSAYPPKLSLELQTWDHFFGGYKMYEDIILVLVIY